MRSIRTELLRFVAVGGLNTGLTYLLYLALLRAMPYSAAYTGSFAVGVFISYHLTAKLVFRVGATWRGALKYPAVYAVQWLLSILMLYVLVEKLGMSKAVAPVVIVAVSVPVTFVLSRFVILTSGMP